MALTTIPHVEIARVGEWVASTGPWKCTREQIADAQRAYEAKLFRVPRMRRGHTDERFDGDVQAKGDGEPALGILRNVTVGNDGNSLFADLRLPSDLAEDLPAVYPHRSIEADLGVKTADGHEFAMVVTGLALLGETPPAIHNLEELPDMDESPMAYVAASSLAASIPVAAGFFDEAAHPRGGKGSAAGGKFVAKGSGYKDKKDGQGQGEEADTVRAVQHELIRLGLLSKDSGKNAGKDGLFGPKTEAAVKKWQRMHGHEETGHVTQALLRTLKNAKSANPAADRRAKKAPVAPKEPHLLRHGKSRVKAAAEDAAPEGLDVREILTDTVVYDDEQGRVWVASFDDDGETVTVGESAPAVVSYTPLAASAGALAAHALHLPVQWRRGRDAQTVTASLGETSVSITPAVREALGLDESADEGTVEAALLARLTAPVEQPANQENPPVIEPVVSSAQNDPSNEGNAPSTGAVEALVAAKVAAAIGPVLAEQATLKASQSAYETKIGELSGELAARKAKEAEDHKTRVLASAAQQGKFAPADRAEWEKSYDEAPVVTERILASMKPGTAVPITASGYAGDGSETPDDFAGFESAFGWEGASNG